jgi:hypothetical protein
MFNLLEIWRYSNIIYAKGLVELLLGCLHLGRIYLKESCHEMDIFFLNAYCIKCFHNFTSVPYGFKYFL